MIFSSHRAETDLKVSGCHYGCLRTSLSHSAAQEPGLEIEMRVPQVCEEGTWEHHPRGKRKHPG